ncbi:DUF342 domain-containing protein [Lactococcus protaetiae]|uniref:DUF342 domain-containing protein n=1 Tax=Lactococcus protaetiae TaxID=2592653 RepID=A0A514Z813_9LACT|nr:DUF342 domain-containing protein [Lactococcus protaetiae]QDK70729.1 DUF342 domain-containing protein [Lactococcus protaetiae]
MAGDRNADKRVILEREIRLKENQLDDLSQEQHTIQNQIEKFQNNMSQLFRQEEECYYMLHQEGERIDNQTVTLQEVSRVMREMSDRQSDELEQGYRIARINAQEEIEQLHRERNALAWD